jgi:hypothetical protein
MIDIHARWREFVAKFKELVWEHGGIGDMLLPPLLFALFNSWLGLSWAVIAGFLLALGFLILRLIQGESLWQAISGAVIMFVAAGLAWALRRASAYFLPSIITGALTIVTGIISVLLRRPLTAVTSYVARQWPLEETSRVTTLAALAVLTFLVSPRPLLIWTTYASGRRPLDWYWHPKVRPAYTEVTLFWTLFFALRLILQWAMYRQERPDVLAVIDIVGGWPAVILLFIGSYRYGMWRLTKLDGPSVKEFTENQPPPWESEAGGF